MQAVAKIRQQMSRISNGPVRRKCPLLAEASVASGEISLGAADPIMIENTPPLHRLHPSSASAPRTSSGSQKRSGSFCFKQARRNSSPSETKGKGGEIWWTGNSPGGRNDGTLDQLRHRNTITELVSVVLRAQY